MSINNKTEATSKIITNFPDNGNGNITALLLRNWLLDFINWVFPSTTPTKGSSLKVSDDILPYQSLVWDILQPTGAVISYAGTSIPDGWLLCDGGAVSQATYPDLFVAIGTTYNISSVPSGQFNLPDMKGRVVVSTGQQSTNINPLEITSPNYNLGDVVGINERLITVNNLPPHNHDVGSLFVNNDTHNHEIGTNQDDFDNSGGGISWTSDSPNPETVSKSTRDDTHNHILSGSVGYTGNGVPVENRSPMIALNYIIKT